MRCKSKLSASSGYGIGFLEAAFKFSVREDRADSTSLEYFAEMKPGFILVTERHPGLEESAQGPKDILCAEKQFSRYAAEDGHAANGFIQ